MKDKDKSKDQLIKELTGMRLRVVELEELETRGHQARVGLWHAKQNWERTFDAVPDLIAILDTNFQIVHANKAMANRLGLTPEECIGHTCYRVIHGTDQPPSFCPYNRLVKDGQEHTAEVEEKHLGGYFIVSASPLMDEDGQVIGCVHVAWDITERKLAEEALRVSENNYRTIFENTQDVFYRLDHTGSITHISPSCMRYSGYTPDELIGKSVLSFYYDPEDSQEFLKAINEKGEVNDYETRIRSKGNTLVYVSATAHVVLDSAGKQIGIEGTLRDVTQRKRMEQALHEKETLLRATLESTADGILVVDERGRVTHANARFAALWRIPPEMISTRDDNTLLQYVLNQLEEPEPFLAKVRALYQSPDEELDTLKFKDGRFLERYSCPLFREGRISGRVWSFRDVTERKRAEEKLKRHRDHLEQTVEARTTELQSSKGELEIKTRTLEEVNIALKVLLHQIEEDKKSLEERFAQNIKQLILPYVEKIKKGRLDATQYSWLSIIETNLNEIVSPFLHSLRQFNFTPREKQIASLIKDGKTTKEIADTIGVAPSAVDTYRNKIRHKLDLNNKKINLQSYLQSMT